MEKEKNKKRDELVVDFINDILKDVSERLFSCRTINVSKGEYRICFEKNTNVDGFFLFPFMLDAVKECVEHMIMTSYISSENVKRFADEIYQKTCEKFKGYLKEKFYINVDDIIWLSSLFHEGEVANGNVCFALDNVTNMEIGVQIMKEQDYVLLDAKNGRQIRKWLEVTRDEENCTLGMLFVFEGKKWLVKGFSCLSAYNKKYFRIHFTRHMVWEIYHEDRMLVSYDGGRYSNSQTDEKTEFTNKVASVLCDERAAAECVRHVWQLVEEAKNQKHGTSLLVLLDDDASKEAERICEESVGTRLIECDSENRLTFVRHLTAIDGTLIVDKKGRILAYGVLLNSKSEIKAKRDPSRGSRYHSVRDYIVSRQQAKEKAIVVIVSEDRMVNFYSTYDAEKEQDEK